MHGHWTEQMRNYKTEEKINENDKQTKIHSYYFKKS